MTDSSSLHTQNAPSVPGSALKTVHPQASLNPQDDEPEDYTIKCICGYDEDDGNTVYCDTCDTWQHTECYYIDEHGAVPTNEDLKNHDHSCADCQPRPLDRRGAIERQRDRRKELDPGDRRVKKPASKSHKKKIKVPDANGPVTNGWSHGHDGDFHERTSRSPRDPHPPTKKTKTSHRFSSSMNFPVLLPNATSNPHKRSASNVNSPPKAHTKYSSAEFAKEAYSVEFLRLYDNDPGDISMQTNLLSDIDITRDLGNWSNDVDELSDATNGLAPSDVFNRCEQPVASMTLPQLNKEYKQDEKVVIHGRHPKWKYLTIDSFTPKDSIVAELKGKIGHMQRYIQDPANRWDYLRHPAPFVFFHPRLPIYIDTRGEGTTCRYLRRSCDPNLSMKTFLENDSEYHFCFVAKQDLDANSELTIGWVLDEHIRNYFSARNHGDVKLEAETDEDYVADWVGKVLAEFGGCACNSDKCALAKYDRRAAGSVKGRNGYTGKHSPPDTGYATNSRAGSEQDERRSHSGSKTQSRDMTPTHNEANEQGIGGGIEISDREKRKIAALEKNFEQLENDKHQPAQKRKKRPSGGSNVNTPSAGASVSRLTYTSSPSDNEKQKQLGNAVLSHSQPNTPGLPSKSHYSDASTSRRKSGSPTSKSSSTIGRPRNNTTSNAKKRTSHPNTPLVPSPLIKQNYVSSAMQTDPEEDADAWYRPPTIQVAARKPYMSLTKRLLLRSQQDRAKLEERRKAALEPHEAGKPNGVVETNKATSPTAQDAADVEMRDADSAHSPPWTNISEAANTQNPSSLFDRNPTAEIKPPPPWPTDERYRPINGYRSSDLRVQLPPKPTLSLDSTSSTPLVETPTSTTQTPFTTNPPPLSSSQSHSLSGLVQPSPIKKKISLKDYSNRRKGSQPATDSQTSTSPMMHSGALKPPPLANGTSKDVEMQGSAVIDTPKVEENNPIEESKEGKDLKT
ncbi:SET domain-containing protein 3 [Lecanora helva]